MTTLIRIRRKYGSGYRFFILTLKLLGYQQQCSLLTICGTGTLSNVMKVMHPGYGSGYSSKKQLSTLLRGITIFLTVGTYYNKLY